MRIVTRSPCLARRPTPGVDFGHRRTTTSCHTVGGARSNGTWRVTSCKRRRTRWRTRSRHASRRGPN